MAALRTVLAEIVGLFVDDGALALALVLWCAGVGALTLALPSLPALLPSLLLIAGCVVILLTNIIASARKRRAGT